MKRLFALKKFASRKALVDQLLLDTFTKLMEAVKTDGNAAWAISGGSTPKALFEAINAVAMDWSNIAIALVDDRWVPTDHDRSNDAFVHNSLLQHEAAAASFTGMYSGHATPQEAEEHVEAQYAALKSPFDLMHLGMGPDGHTASLFPDAEGVERAFTSDRRTVAVTAKQSAVTGEEILRMTLTAQEIVKAGHVNLTITGNDKLAVLQDAEAGADLPIGRLALMLDTPLEVYWAE